MLFDKLRISNSRANNDERSLEVTSRVYTKQRKLLNQN